MSDVLDGLVLDVVDGGTLELEVEHVDAPEPSLYGAREYVLLADPEDREAASSEEAAALMGLTYQNRRVRCYVERRDSQGRIVGEVEVLSAAQPDAIYGGAVDDDS